MKLSLKWLAEFFPEIKDKGGFTAEHSRDLRHRLPLAGLEANLWKQPGKGIEDVIVARIESFEKHPKADRLNVCQVHDGKQTLQIVCGAPNVKAGVKVALAPVGSTLPGDFKIKEAKIRDVASFGMLCSEKELGLSEESNGILHLPDSAPLGAPFAKALGLQDEIWEVELTPDRADCLSHWGMAREVGRLLHRKGQYPEIETLNTQGLSDVPLLSVEVTAKQACPLYGAQLFEGIQNRPSPEWMRRRLESCGHRSIDALVDITNYVLQELGQPLHAFDADKITGSKILVRMAKKGESITTLDGVKRELSPEDLVIADLEKPLALAGVMGGADSGVTAGTKRVVLEAAVFDPIVVRQMAARHKIHSEASHRFERGVDAANVIKAAGRAALLFKQITEARRRGSYIEIQQKNAEKLLQSHSMNFDLRAFKNVVALEAEPEEVAKALQSVGIECEVKSRNVLKVDVPTHRLDLTREIDLVEESARLLGYERIPATYPALLSRTPTLTTSAYQQLRRARRRLLELGLCEMMPYAFVADRERDALPHAQLVELANPLSNDWRYMRPNLSFGLLSVVARHAALGQLSGAFFDAGNVFAANPSTEARATGAKESYHLAWALMGERVPAHWSSDKKSRERGEHCDYFDAKGVAEALAPALSEFEARWGGLSYLSLDSVPAAALQEQAPWIPLAWLHPGRSALLSLPGAPPGTIVGYVGELHPAKRGALLNLATGFQLGVALGEVRVVPDILAYLQKDRTRGVMAGQVKLSKRLPVVERDLALVVAADVKSADLGKTLARAAGQELLELRCVDLFKLPTGKNSLLFRVSLQGNEKTLDDAEIKALTDRMLQEAAKKHGAELRA